MTPAQKIGNASEIEIAKLSDDLVKVTDRIYKSPNGAFYRHCGPSGYRLCFGVLIKSGLRIEKLDQGSCCWVYLDTLPDFKAFKSLVRNSK